MDYDDLEIDGVVCTATDLGKRAYSASACGDCSFSNWSSGDLKYIVEHSKWREHLCPVCAIRRGLPRNCFHKNVNDDRECPSEPEFDEENVCSSMNCPSKVGTTVHIVGKYKTSTLLTVMDDTTNKKIMLCAACWLKNAVVEAKRVSGDYDEDVSLDDVVGVCTSVETARQEFSQSGQKRAAEPNNEDNDEFEQPRKKLS